MSKQLKLTNDELGMLNFCVEAIDQNMFGTCVGVPKDERPQWDKKKDLLARLRHKIANAETVE